MPLVLQHEERTIDAGQNTHSSPVCLEGHRVFGIHIPALSPNSTVEVQVSKDGTTFQSVKDIAGTSIALWATGAGDYAMDADALARVAVYRYIRVRFATVQAAAKVITFALAPN